MNELRIMREEERKAKEAELRDITARWDEMQTEEKMVEEYEKAGRLAANSLVEMALKLDYICGLCLSCFSDSMDSVFFCFFFSIVL